MVKQLTGAQVIHMAEDIPALKDIKVMKDDPVAVEAQAEQIKTRYLSYFKV